MSAGYKWLTNVGSAWSAIYWVAWLSKLDECCWECFSAFLLYDKFRSLVPKSIFPGTILGKNRLRWRLVEHDWMLLTLTLWFLSTYVHHWTIYIRICLTMASALSNVSGFRKWRICSSLQISIAGRLDSLAVYLGAFNCSSGLSGDLWICTNPLTR